MNLLVIKYGALGDVVRTSYFLPGLLHKYGDDARLYWLTSKVAAEVLRFNPYVYKVLTDPVDAQAVDFEGVISLDDEWDSAITASNVRKQWLKGAFVNDKVVSYTDDTAAWFDMGLISRFGKAEADRLKKLNTRSHADVFSEILGIRVDRAYFYGSSLLEQHWRESYPQNMVKIGVNPFAGKRWPAKSLRQEELAIFVERLLDVRVDRRKTYLFFFGEGEDRVTLQELARNYPGRINVPDTSGSLLDFAAAIKSLDYLITTDSLALHFAISQGVRNLSFYAPTSAAEIDTFGSGQKVISTGPDYCSYSKNADNSSITAGRLMQVIRQDFSLF